MVAQDYVQEAFKIYKDTISLATCSVEYNNNSVQLSRITTKPKCNTSHSFLLCLPMPSLSVSLNTIVQLTNSDPTEPVAKLCFTQMTISISYYL